MTQRAAIINRLEAVLDRERDQLALWLPVAVGAGIAAWFVIPRVEGWIAFVLASLGLAGITVLLAGTGRAGRAGAIFFVTMTIGCALVWWRAENMASQQIEGPRIVRFTGRIEAVDLLAARETVRLTIAPDAGQGLPARLRVNLDQADAPPNLAPSYHVAIRARLMPPPGAALPGAYDFARVAWFHGIGATGRALDPVVILDAGGPGGFGEAVAAVRTRLTAHIHHQLDGSGGGIAASFVTGDQGAIAESDADAMRTSGLAHLLSISGLHVSVVIGATMFLMMRLLALSPALALHFPLPAISAGIAAIAAIAYTIIAGAEVPTVRSCIAAMLILMALVLGREAMTLRLVAAGALVILIVWPEALVGPSFQMSFAAVAAIIVFHDHPRIRSLFQRREEGFGWKIGRAGLSILLTGFAIELALTPIALFHFHRTGIYGAFSNIIAIPLTSFVIMPLEALALLLDLVGLGGPIWWLTGQSIHLLLKLASTISALPGASAALPHMPVMAFSLMLIGSLWLCLWRTRLRAAGIPLFVIGAVWTLLTPAPDILVTGDGKHVAIRDAAGKMALLRPRAGDYVRDMLGEAAGDDVDAAIEDLPQARCSADLCIVPVTANGRTVRLMATRSPYLVEWRAMTAACNLVDIVISDRRLPRGCSPHWLKLDRPSLSRTGGVTMTLDPLSVRTVRPVFDDHPWMPRAATLAPYRHND